MRRITPRIGRGVRWTVSGTLVVTEPALYDSENIHIMMAKSAGCRCSSLAKAISEKDLGLLMDVKGDNGAEEGNISNPRIVLGDQVLKWCPFCGKSLKLKSPKYTIGTALP